MSAGAMEIESAIEDALRLDFGDAITEWKANALVVYDIATEVL